MQLRSRLYLDWQALRHSYPYRWAHKPLCQRFRADVLKVGRVCLCRSCTLIWVGLLAAIAISTGLWVCGATKASFLPASWVTALATAIAVGSFNPLIYQRLSRPLRDVQRLLSGLAGGTAIHLLTLGAWYVAVPALVLLLIARALYQRRRGQRKLQACDGCPELGTASICSGFTMQAGLIRRFEGAAEDYLESQGVQPPGLG